jgi:hypothetical protein
VSVSPPPGRIFIAFDSGTLVWAAAWTRIDSYPSLVASYTIDRGRQYELDKTDTGRAIIQINDTNGVLDPTNPAGPYYGKLEPLLQVMIGRQHPFTGDWHTRFRGFIEDYDYSFDPSQQVNRLTITCVDIFEILNAIELQPGQFGTPAEATAEEGDQVVFKADSMHARILAVLGSANANIPDEFYTGTVFTGNVTVKRTVYAPGESVLAVVQEAADAEFPGVSNVYTDCQGRLSVHGRLAKFDPASASFGSAWTFNEWDAGDAAALATVPGAARIRRFGYNRGLAKVINIAAATPFRAGVGLTTSEANGQVVKDTVSIGKYGYRSWSADNLITDTGQLNGNNDLQETKLFAQYYVDNYANPKPRVTEIQFRAMTAEGAVIGEGARNTWDLLSSIDIADSVTIYVGSPGGGGFPTPTSGENVFYVEGIHEEVRPLQADYDDVTLSLDLSPKAYFDTNPFPTG